jgi:hypothetical protein
MQKFDDRDMLTEGVHTLPPEASLLPLHSVIKDSDRLESLRTGKPIAKTRLCVDAKRARVNEFVAPWPMRYATAEHAARLLRKDCYMAVVDIESFFPSLPFAPDFAPYTYISDPRRESAKVAHPSRPTYGLQRGPRFRRFSGVYFGLKTAAAYASTISAEIQQICNARVAEYNVSFYCDDALIVAEGDSRADCQAALDDILAVIRDLGLRVQESKITRPCKAVEYLGVILNTEDMTLTPKPSTVRHVRERIAAILKSGVVLRAELKRLVGKCSWLAAVIPGARTYMRSFVDAVWAPHKHVHIDAEFRRDAQWWLDHTVRPAGSIIITADGSIPVVSAKSDASGHLGYGYLHCHQGQWRAHFGRWTASRRKHGDMTAKELFPLISLVEQYGPSLANKLVRFACDNSSTCYCINRGSSRDPDTMQLLRRLADAQVRHNFIILGVHIGRETNTTADILTRFTRISQLQDELARDGATVDPQSCRKSPWHFDRTWSDSEYVMNIHASSSRRSSRSSKRAT